MMMSKTYVDGAILTILRPGGETEEVVNRLHARGGVIPATVFASMVKATSAANRGEILGQRPNVMALPLDVQRMEIAGKLADLSGKFPSASKALAEKSLTAELAAFDAAHPEIIAQIQSAKTARTADGVARAMRAED